MFVLKLSLITWLIAAQDLVASAENAITCYGNVQRLSCREGLIKVKSAIYGRTDHTVCSAGRRRSEIRNTRCSLSIPLISKRCDGQIACEFKTDVLPSHDPCIGTYKYYNTTYDCIQGRISVTCEGGYSKLDCGDSMIQIIGANYGRTDQTTCSDGIRKRMIKNTNCHAPHSLTRVITRCNNKRRCAVEASNTIFTDPCFGTYKYLTVSYFCRPHPVETSVTCEGNTACLACGTGVLKIHSANYGRTDFTTCSPGHFIIRTDCYAWKTMAEVVRRCEGRRYCLVPATNYVFSDPCWGTYKYLTVRYSCVDNGGFLFSQSLSSEVDLTDMGVLKLE
ncbi:rhamnose-binding lectin-like [Salminus brasiliensis]|uniref:rhamnose-binding lectin-like n=1 Tax=Salminus brasiliensis TaxID=930266 RepID=UPI003B83A213